jgi:hypothetical protein
MTWGMKNAITLARLLPKKVRTRVFIYLEATPEAGGAQRRLRVCGYGPEMHSGRYLRFDPKTVSFAEYVLPEPYGIDRETWIDNSTDPVTVWYVDHEG